jgi:hypothetical protein
MHTKYRIGAWQNIWGLAWGYLVLEVNLLSRRRVSVSRVLRFWLRPSYTWRYGFWPHIFHTVFVSVYHYAISEPCKGLYHNGVWHESSRVLRFTGFDHRRERRRLEYALSSPTLWRR